jgi:uncharacterized membrane protein
MKLQDLVARILRIGLVASLALIGAGVLVEETSTASRHRRSLGSGSFPHGLAAVAHGVASGSGPAVVDVGIALLVCTPIAAVIAAVIAWRRRGDVRMAAVGAAVVGVLGLSCALAVIGV